MTRARTAAILALVLLAAGALGAVYDFIDDFPVAVLLLVAFGLALWAGWAGLLRTGAARVAGLGGAGALLAVVVVTIAVEGVTLGDVLVLGCLAAAVAAARVAFIVHIPLARVAPPARPTLFVNPWSGGGKAERFRLVDEARERGSRRSSSTGRRPARARRRGDRAVAPTGWPWRAATARRPSSPRRRRARPAVRLHPRRDPEPLRPGPRRRSRRRRRRPGRVRRRGRAPRRPGGGQRPGVRQQRLARRLRRGRAARRATATRSCGPCSRRSRRRSGPRVRASTCAGRGRAATSTPAVPRCSSPTTATGWGARSPPGRGPRIDDGLLGVTVLGAPRGRGESSRSLQRPWREWSAPTFDVEAIGSRADRHRRRGRRSSTPPLRFRILPACCARGSPPRIPVPHRPRTSPTAPWQRCDELCHDRRGASQTNN